MNYGVLFQNRYKSILCEEDTYLLELVRYIHLNPVRARVIGDMEELNTYPLCGHSADGEGGAAVAGYRLCPESFR